MSNIREGRGGGNIRSYLWPKAPFPMASPRVPPPPHVHNWQCPSASPSSLPQSSCRGNPTSQLWSSRLHPWGPHSHTGDVPPTLPPPGLTPPKKRRPEWLLSWGVRGGVHPPCDRPTPSRSYLSASRHLRGKTREDTWKTRAGRAPLCIPAFRP